MASLLQTKTSSKTSSAGTTSTVVLNTTQTGSLIVVAVNTDKSGTAGVTGISCSGMTFVQGSDILEGTPSAIADVAFWYALNITGATTPTLTVTYAAGMIGGAIVREYEGFGGWSLDKLAATKDANTQGTALNSGATATLVGLNDLVVVWGGTGDSGNTYTAGTGFANATTLKIGTTVDMGMCDGQVNNATTAQTGTMTIGNVSNWVCGVATFKTTGLGIRSKQSFTSNANQTIASVVAGDTALFVAAVGDSDHTHTAFDSANTLGGVSMTQLQQQQSANNQADIWIMGNCAGGAVGSNVTFSMKYHAGSPGFLGAFYVFYNANTTQPTTSNKATNAASTNPSVALSGVNAVDLIVEVVSGSTTQAVAASQIIDFTGTGGSQFFNIATKVGAAGTNTESWTAASGDWCIAAVAVAGISAVAAFKAAKHLVVGQAITRAAYF